MNTTTVEQIASLDDGDIIKRLEGKITKAYEVKSGGSGDKAWTVQNGMFRDSTGESRIVFWNREDVTPYINNPVVLEAYKGDKGWSGIYASNNEYKGETRKEIKVTKTADLNKANSTPAEAPSARREPQGGSTPRPAPRNEPAGDMDSVRQELMRVANLFYLIKKAIGAEVEQSAVDNIATPEAMFQAQCSTAFIHLDRLGMVADMPEKPLWSIGAKHDAAALAREAGFEGARVQQDDSPEIPF